MPALPYISGRENNLTEDPLLAFTFKLEVKGVLEGFFTECNGIGSENEVVEHKVVDTNGHEVVRKIPGRLKWTDITLKRGITTNLQIWDWRDMIVKGKMKDARKPITITMLDREYKPLVAWNFTNAWPSKVSGPAFKADDNNYGVEEVTIVHEGMNRDT